MYHSCSNFYSVIRSSLWRDVSHPYPLCVPISCRATSIESTTRSYIRLEESADRSAGRKKDRRREHPQRAARSIVRVNIGAQMISNISRLRQIFQIRAPITKRLRRALPPERMRYFDDPVERGSIIIIIMVILRVTSASTIVFAQDAFSQPTTPALCRQPCL